IMCKGGVLWFFSRGLSCFGLFNAQPFLVSSCSPKNYIKIIEIK
ncbi:uncharacterized protein METZ01_LOCUS83491, partial [marine metagenome]